MKKSKIIIAIILILSIILAASNVFAETSVSWAKASYDQTGSVNETKVANIAFQNATDNIGVVSGTINFNTEYIQVISVEKGDWALTYNEANGRFNTVKSTGAGFGSLMKITYKIIKEVNSDTNIISISDIKYTSTRYETYLEANTLNLKMIKGSSTGPSNTTNNTNTSNTTNPTNNTNTSNSTNPSNNTNSSNTTNPSNNIDNSSSGNVYNTGITVTPAKVIYDASVEYSVSPKVILATLQKESSLVSSYHADDSLSSSCFYFCMGAGSSSSSSTTGFQNQIDLGTSTLQKWYEDGNNNYAFPYYYSHSGFRGYKGYNSSGYSTAIWCDNAATYSLYKYTPYTCASNSNTHSANVLFLEIYNGALLSDFPS